jgi:hypothetical protein
MSTQVRICAHGIGHPIHPGRAGAADRNDLPSRQPWRPALPVPPAGPPPSELRRALTSERPDPSDPAGRNADRERSAGAPGGHPGGCKRALERTILLKGGLQPPLGRRDHEAPRPQDGTGSMRSAGDFVRPATSAGSRTRRTRAGAVGRWRGQLSSWRRSTRPREHRETTRGLQPGLRKNVLFKGGLQPPRAVQGSKPFSNGLAPRSPATRARILSKAADPTESREKSADWRCIHALFPVKNQIIP